jgi:hypothetical protein
MRLKDVNQLSMNTIYNFAPLGAHQQATSLHICLEGTHFLQFPSTHTLQGHTLFHWNQREQTL